MSLQILAKIVPAALLFIISAIFVVSNLAHANNWVAPVYKSVLPEKIVAVDKSKQLFHYFEENNPSTLKYTFICTTGQVDGDKQVMNDLKTPEGVYFVQYKISEGLDFAEYGGIAYTLNYPNPVDKLRGKTGYGIWIHSKGLGIKPKDTRGCIAIGLDELTKVGPKLSYGTAVLLAEKIKINESSNPNIDIRSLLIVKMEEWTKAWSSRSHSMFNMYNQAAYSKAMPESFRDFKANKVYLFKLLPWINIFNRKMYALEGPGYWVTWSEQFYSAPNLSTEGIRRLYWQLDNNNEYKIVGMEWIPRNLGMKADYLKGKLVTSTLTSESTLVSDSTSKSHIKTSEVPEHPAINMPEKDDLEQVKDVDTTKLNDTKEISLNPKTKTILQEKMSGWLNAWQSKSNNFFDYYDQVNFGMISDFNNKNRETRQHSNFIKLKQSIQQHFSAKWIEIMSRPVFVGITNNTLYTECELLVRSNTQAPIEGILRLYWKKSSNNQYLIIDSSWQEKNLNIDIEFLEEITPIIYELISDWQKAWLNANIDEYASFYTNDAIQQNLKGKENITNHKKIIWETSKPKNIKLTGFRLLLDPAGLIVDMTQHYESSKGFSDVGTKILLLQPTKDGYLILNEKWTPLN